MVKISDVLEQRKLESSACVAHVSQTQPTRVLSYRDAWKALKEHEAWLKGVGYLLPTTSTGTSTGTIINHHGDDVVLAYLSSNSTDMMISMLAAASSSSTASFTVALLNTRWTPSEMAAVLQTSTSRTTIKTATTIILYSAEFRDKALETQSILRHATHLSELPSLTKKYLTEYHHHPGVSSSRHIPSTSSDKAIDFQIRTCAVTNNSGDDDALVVFTSGTTSGSKGVRLSHKALWIQALAKLRQPCQYSSTTKMLSTTVPLFHVGGLSSTLALWLAGGTWMVPVRDDAAATCAAATAGFNPLTVLSLVSHPTTFPVNTLVVVPAMLHAILLQARVPTTTETQQQQYPNVELILIGGQSASETMLVSLHQLFPNARLVQTYACTEAASSMTFHEPALHSTSLPNSSTSNIILAGDCIGQPPPHVQLQLVEQQQRDDTDMGTVSLVAKPYQVGILATRGPHLMSGYYWNRDGTYPPPSRRKWFLTNDLGFRDDAGRYYFCGRVNDVIRTGGETVIALEVERILLQHDAIDECAVFALPDDRFGEAVCAAIVLKKNSTNKQSPVLTLHEIRQHHCQLLAGYKRPRRLFYVDALPRNSSGKVLKYQLVLQFTAPSTCKL